MAAQTTVTAAGRMVTITPSAKLKPATDYKVVVDAGLESEFGELTLGPAEFKFKTADKAVLRFDGTYAVSHAIPSFGPPGSPPPPDSNFTIVATASDDGSAKIVVKYPNAPVEWTGVAIVSGNRLFVPPIPMPAGNAFADGFSGLTADLLDDTGDGIADRVSGGTGASGARGYTLAGPGFEFKDLTWNLVKK